MKKILLLIFLIALITIPNSLAYFTRSHRYWILKGFEQVDSPITQKCAPYIDIVMDVNTAADVPVLHYYDANKVSSYKSTHTRGVGYLNCLEEAGSDVKEQCFCYGQALHFGAQDPNSHLPGGIVVEKLKQFFGNNLLGHMIVERNFENKHMELIKSTEPELFAKVEEADKIVLNNLFQETGGDEKYLELLHQMSGLDMAQDAKIFRNGYLGEGFYNTVYKDKISLPFWGWAIAAGLMVLGLGMIFIVLKVGVTSWRWLLVAEWMVVLVLGSMITISFITGTTWQVTQAMIEIPPMFGYLSVTNDEVADYDARAQAMTNKFLETGVVEIDDGSGLSFVDRFGALQKGPLEKAEEGFWFIVLPVLLVVFFVINFWLFKKAIRG